MNLSMFKKNIGWRMKLAPPVCHLDTDGTALPEKNEDWIVHSVSDDVIVLKNSGGDDLKLGTDHVVSYYTNPHEEGPDNRSGILALKMQVYLRDGKFQLAPTPRPGERVPPPPATGAKLKAQLSETSKVFHTERMALVAANKGFIAHMGGALLVLHIFPASALDGRPSDKFAHLAGEPDLFPPMADNRPRDFRVDFEGLLTGSNSEGLEKDQRSHVRVLRTGVIESVASSVDKGQSDDLLSLPNIQAMIIKYAFLYTRALASVGIEPPYAIECSLANVKNKRLLHDFIPTNAFAEDMPQKRLNQASYDFVEETMEKVPQSVDDCAKQIKDLLNHIANAAGLKTSPYFDAKGNYKLNP